MDVEAFVAKAAEVEAERNALRQFKAYVHERLDAAGVPTHPDGPHSAEGCRIGDRLDIALGAVDVLREIHMLVDFAEPIEAGEPTHYDDPSLINAAHAKAYAIVAVLSSSEVGGKEST